MRAAPSDEPRKVVLHVKSHHEPVARSQWSTYSRRVNIRTSRLLRREPLPKECTRHCLFRRVVAEPSPFEPRSSMARGAMSARAGAAAAVATATAAELTITSFIDSERPPDLNRRSERAVRNESVCYRFLRWIVLSISSTFVVGGGFGLGMTLWALSKTAFLQHLVKSSSAGIYLLIVTVVLLFIAGVIGFLGVLRHNQAVLGSFSVLLFVTLISSLVGGIWTYITATRYDELSLQRVVHYVRHDYGRDPGKTALLDIIQQSFHCCGSDSYGSWAFSTFTSANRTTPSDGSTFTVPDSCCIDPQSQICRERRHSLSNDTDISFIYTNGCLDKLKATFVPYGSYALSASVSVGVLQVTGFLGSVRLCRAIRYFANIGAGS